MQALCRLSVLYQRPLHEIAQWPAAEVRLILAYLAKLPPAIERVELATAYQTGMLANRWRKEGAPAYKTSEFLFFSDPWPAPQLSGYSDLDQEVLSAFGFQGRMRA